MISYVARRLGFAGFRRLTTRSNVSLMRPCQPGPSSLKASTMTGSSRNVTCSFGRASFGRPKRTRRRSAASISSGITSRTGRALRKNSSVSSGLSSSGTPHFGGLRFGIFMWFSVAGAGFNVAQKVCLSAIKASDAALRNSRHRRSRTSSAPAASPVNGGRKVRARAVVSSPACGGGPSRSDGAGASP